MEKQQIINLVDYINRNANSINIEEAINELIKNIEQWGKTAQPKQTDMQGENTGDNDNEQFAHLIRNLAVNLNNNYGRPAEALLISNVLKSVFAEIPEFVKLIDNDLEILSKFIKIKEEQERE